MMDESKILTAVPVLPAADVRAAIDFYVQKAGFTEDFCNGEPPNYGGVSRDGVRIHLCQTNEARTIGEQTMLRFAVRGAAALYEEMKQTGALHPNTVFKEMLWGTTEFTILDADGVCVTFFEG